jgi:hypothetical protein
MPNFHTHWLVALQAIDGLPEQYRYLKQGRKTYVEAGKAFGKTVRDHVSDILKKLDLDGSAGLQEWMKDEVTAWEDKLRANHDAICFSAFMLGACGPDFWMLPSKPNGGIKPDMAEHHFDLGHYNRSHRQFELSLRELQGKDDLQARVEKSYFLGMSTHIAADLVIHQLVNVSAGAYNLLKYDSGAPNGIWSNEQGIEYLSPDAPASAQPAPEGNWFQRRWGDAKNLAEVGKQHVVENGTEAAADALPIWSTHNKVEHYWDTWVRYRWLGDAGKFWEDDVDAPFPTLGLPLSERIRADLIGGGERIADVQSVAGMGKTVAHKGLDVWRTVGRAVPWVDHSENVKDAVTDRANYVLGSVETRWLLEKPLSFPWLFCDAVLRGTCKPFIYDRVVSKETGAYPKDMIFESASTEAKSSQMDEPLPMKLAPREKQQAPGPGGGGKSEKRKLQVFSTESNHAIPAWSWNYINYISCPSFGRLLLYGQDTFYDRAAFPHFVSGAVRAAKAFSHDLATSYAGGKQLEELGRFWNLDTGLGLQIENVESPERHQVVTRIDWVHVLGPAGKGGEIPYQRQLPPPYTTAMAAAPEPYPLAAWKKKDRVCLPRSRSGRIAWSHRAFSE